MMSRGISSPSCVRRNPVSIAWPARVRISITSPFFPSGGTLTTTRAMRSACPLDQSFFQACRERDDHFHALLPERAIRHLRDRDDVAGVGDARARGDARFARTRAEVRAEHVRLRIAL